MLEKTDEAVASLITKFNDVTPQLMETFKQQLQVSYAYDVIGIGLCCLLIVIGAIVWIWADKKYKADGSDFYWMVRIISILVMVVCFICIIFNVMDLIQLTLNPDYYIIERYIKPLISPSYN